MNIMMPVTRGFLFVGALVATGCSEGAHVPVERDEVGVYAAVLSEYGAISRRVSPEHAWDYLLVNDHTLPLIEAPGESDLPRVMGRYFNADQRSGIAAAMFSLSS